MEVHKSAQEVYTRRVPAPHPDSVNTGLSYLKPATCRKLLGEPRLNKDYTDDYQMTDNPAILSLLVRREVTGLGRVTGLKPAVDSLERIATRVRHEAPNLLSVLSSGGMFNCRRIRGTKDTPSNHAWGCAIDVMVAGRYDTPGDGMTFVALLDLYSFFHAEGWFWGTEFRHEDSMHFEVADETLRSWLGDHGLEAKMEEKAKATDDTDAKAVKAKVAAPTATQKKVLKHIEGLDRAGLISFLETEGATFNRKSSTQALLNIATRKVLG